ncbi:hypothetical protein SNQ60_002202 [Cronobacter turicensis]|nr:hypothetical protein [Cronobacter turicensis]
MKLYMVVILAALALTGCDNNKVDNQAQKVSAQESVEQFVFECVKDTATQCNIVAGDLLGAGKWHHATVYVYPDNIDANIDGEHFSKDSFDSGLFEGQKISTYKLKSATGKIAEFTVSEKGAAKRFSLEAWGSDGKKYLTASR